MKNKLILDFTMPLGPASLKAKGLFVVLYFMDAEKWRGISIEFFRQ
jgi:hypothetical protein